MPFNQITEEDDLLRVRELWADADTISTATLTDLLEIGHDMITLWAAGAGVEPPDEVPVSWKIAELYCAIDHWSSLRGGEAQIIGPEGFPVTVNTWQLVLKARDLVVPPAHPWGRLG